MGICYHCFREKEANDICPFCGYDPAKQGEDAAALKPGTKLKGRYLIGHVAGRDCLGFTYLALDEQTSERVEIREYMPTKLSSRDGDAVSVLVEEKNQENFALAKAAYVKEAEKLAAFDGDRHVLRVLECFEENGTAYAAQAHVEGPTLETYLKKQGSRLTPRAAQELLLPLAKGLESLHAAGIEHRGISPDSILITPEGEALLADFGTARYAFAEKNKCLDTVLKRGFAPKEQFVRRGQQGPYTDLYSLAAVWYYAITGKVPQDSIQRMEDDTIIPPSTLGVRLGGEQEEALLKALEVNAADRWKSVGDFCRVMEETPLPETAEPIPAVREQKVPVQAAPAVWEQKVPVQTAPAAQPQAAPASEAAPAETKKGSGKLVPILIAAALILGAVVFALIRIPASKTAKALEEGERLYYALGDQAYDRDGARAAFLRAAEGKNGLACWYLGNLALEGDDPLRFAEAMEYYERASELGCELGALGKGELILDGLGVEKDPGAARILFEQALERGCTEANLYLAFLYHNGDGVDKDGARALEYYTAALDSKVPEIAARATRNIGRLYYYENKGIEQNFPKARECFEQAAALGSPSALSDVANMYYDGKGESQDYTKAREWYEKAAEKGSSFAMFRLGVLYEYGYGVKQDYAKAREWYEKGASFGDQNAMGNLGNLYYQGNGVKQDYAAAKEWFEKGAASGNAYSMNWLGALYQNGEGVEKDIDKAIEWYKKAVEYGSTAALRNLGNLYYRGDDVTQDYKKALEYFLQAAEKGEEDSLFRLGLMYANGEGVTKDLNKAREYYERAAEAGSGAAMNNIGVMYASGEGVTRDYAKAVEWYEKAGDSGDDYALNNLGHMYFNGEGVDKDYTKAREYWERAADLGNTNAMSNLGYMYANGKGVQKDYSKALAYWEKAAAAGDGWSMNRLGVAYMNGDGVKQNYAKALEWFEKGAAAGNATAMRNLGVLYEWGWGVTRDINVAKDWYKKADAAEGKK